MSLSRRGISFSLAAAAFGLALAQRPGLASSDTKIDLHADPVGFLAEAAAVWNPSGGLGQVQGGQYGGYLWPMGPFFALGDLAGVPDWVVQRLWLGLLLALAAWGTVRLLDALLPDYRPLALAVAGTLMLLNPYVVVFANRTSVTLLGYAALPWLLFAAHRGLRVPRGWWWPAAFALIVTSTGGGVNAAVTAWTLLGPILFVAYELVTGGASLRAAGSFALRCAVLSAPAWAWWIAPVLAHAAYGIDFLQFTEQPGAIWGTTSLSESLRLMGYWISYLGVGFGDTLEPYFGDSPLLLFNDAVVVASLLVPGLALAGLVLTRRLRYGAFFAVLVLAGLLAMFTGFPPGTPLRRALTFTYNHVEAVQFLRTTYKAAPLVALGIACLAGCALAALWARVPGLPLRAAVVAVAACLLALAAWPLVRGRALDDQVLWEEIPAAWQQAADGLERELPRNSRAVILPGQLFAFYDWGATVDPVLPALTDRPVAVRNVPPYMDLHGTDMLWTTDSLVQQGRLVPGQLPGLLALLGAGALVTASDDRETRSGAVGPADAARALAGAGFGAADREYGGARGYRAELAPPSQLAQVRRYDVRGGPGIVRVEGGPLTVVDGSAETLAALAAFGEVPRPFVYAGDARALRGAREVVIGDGNRRRTLVSSRARQPVGATLDAGDRPSEDAALLDPFGRGGDAQTVAVYTGGVSWIRAPYNPGFSQFPEHRPYAAFDGDVRTFWLADPVLEEERRHVEIAFERPRDVPSVTLVPAPDRRARVLEVEIAGRRFPMGRGPTRIDLGLRGVRSLRVRIARKRSPAGRSDSAGGFAEIRVPGLRVRELLRTPVLAQRALRGADLARTGVTYVFTRTTGDDPFRRGPDGGFFLPGADDRAAAEPLLSRFPGDAEAQIARRIEPPVTRAWRADAWVSVAPDARDDAIDRVVGVPGEAVFRSSGRFRGVPGLRASSAFDGDPATSWIAPWGTTRDGSWIEWESPSRRTVTRLRLSRPRERVRFPSRVILRSDGGATEPLAVAAGGEVRLPRPISGRRFRLEIEDAGPPRAGAVGAEDRAVGIAELDVGAPHARVPRDGLIGARCGELRVNAGAGTLRLKPIGPVRALDAGEPLRAQACGSAARLPAAPLDVVTASELWRPYHLRLRSQAGRRAPARAQDFALLSAGRSSNGRHEDVRVRLEAPGWLVLAESFNDGWRAWCDDRSLGGPQVLDGYANAWQAPAGCTNVRFEWAPQKAVDWAYLLSGLFCVGLLGFLLVLSGRRHSRPPRPEDWPVRDAARPLPWPHALAWALGLSAAIAFVFALRAGAAAAPIVFLILWRGVPARTLLVAAGLLLVVVVPALYVLFPPDDRGGYNTEYAIDAQAAHWATAAALILIALSARGQVLKARLTRS